MATTSAYDASVDTLAATLAASPPDRLLVIDFDETLWLRNSTEAFLAFATPSWLAVIILATLDCLRPWWVARLWGCSSAQAAFLYRDWMRITAIAVLTPWNLRRWQAHANEVGPAFANQELIAMIEAKSGEFASGRLVVATFGFTPVARPLVASILPTAELISAPLASGWTLRRTGKAAAVAERFGTPALQTALLITDHAQHDQDIIEAVEHAFVIRWPDARFEAAHAGTYFPFRYTTRGKHAGRGHVLRVFLGIDGLALLLTIPPASPNPLASGIATLLLVLSYFVVFEIGYHENDALGQTLEKDPNLTPARLANLGIMDARQAWLWAMAVACIGVWLIAAFDLSVWKFADGTFVQAVLLFLLWCVLLTLSRGLFGLFNRIDKRTRCHVYLPLQLTKGLGIIMILQLPATLAGLMLLLAIAVSRWIVYVVYRYSGRRGEMQDRLPRLLLMLAFLATASLASSSDILIQWSTWLILAWCLFTARNQLADAWRAARWL